MTTDPAKQIASLKMQLDTAKFRLMGGVDSTNTAVDLTPTLTETWFHIQVNYDRLMRRLAGSGHESGCSCLECQTEAWDQENRRLAEDD